MSARCLMGFPCAWSPPVSYVGNRGDVMGTGMMQQTYGLPWLLPPSLLTFQTMMAL